MQRKIILTEEQISRIINEELGIADGVVNLSKEIEDKISSSGKRKLIFNVSTPFGKLKIDYVCMEFKSMDDFRESYSRMERMDGYSYDDNTIYLSTIVINGNPISDDFSDTIQHEVEHFWQSKNAGRSLASDRYSAIAEGMILSKNPAVQKICAIYYYGNHLEIDANVNGSYNTAMKKQKQYLNYKEYIKDTGLKEIYLILKNAEKYLSAYNNSVYSYGALMYFRSRGLFPDNLNWEDIVNKTLDFANESYKYLITKIGKAYSLYTKKAKENKLNEHKVKGYCNNRTIKKIIDKRIV